MSVFLSDEQDEVVDAADLRRFAEFVLAAEGLPEGTEMAVILVSPDQIAEYNREFMDREGPTDVLSFPLQDLQPGRVPLHMANEPPFSLGDVFICPAEDRRRVEREGGTLEDYLYLLVVHGILHLLGYDHGDDGAADAMEDREAELLGDFGRPVE